jgi:hypothetical protein
LFSICTSQGELPMDHLVERYRARVAELKAEYEQAVAHAESVGEQLHAGDLAEPDGTLAYRNALKVERAALSAYEMAVLDLADVVLQGKPPADRPIRWSTLGR